MSPAIGLELVADLLKLGLLLLAPWMLNKLTGYGTALFERLMHVS